MKYIYVLFEFKHTFFFYFSLRLFAEHHTVSFWLRIFSGYSNFQPPPQKNNTSKFQFVLDARTRLNEFLKCPKDGFLLSRSFYVYTYVIFTRVKIEAMDGRPRENVKVERVLRLRAAFRTSPLIYGRKIYVRAHKNYATVEIPPNCFIGKQNCNLSS